MWVVKCETFGKTKGSESTNNGWEKEGIQENYRRGNATRTRLSDERGEERIRQRRRYYFARPEDGSSLKGEFPHTPRRKPITT